MSRQGYVYLFRLGDFHKIGHSKDVYQRAEAFVSLPYPLYVVHAFWSEDACADEKKLHRRYKDVRVNGEWFLLSEAAVEAIKAIPCDPAHPVLRSIGVRLTPGLQERLEEVAAAFGMDLPDVIRMIVEENLGPYHDRAQKILADQARAMPRLNYCI